MDQQYQFIYKEYLATEGYVLNHFFRENMQNLFPKTDTYPAFFNDNLVSQNRIIKRIHGSVHDNIRVFYYQFFKLCFELDVEGSIMFLKYFKSILFHIDFIILFTEETENERDIYNDFQFKKLCAEFLHTLENQEIPDFELILNRFPILDKVFIHLFRSILAAKGINEEYQKKIPTETVFNQLSQLLGIRVVQYDKCYKFEESDIFCYEDSDDDLYIAFMAQEHIEMSQQQIKPQQLRSSNNIKNSNSNNKISVSKLEKNNFVDKPVNPIQKKEVPSKQQFQINQTTKNKKYDTLNQSKNLPTIVQVASSIHNKNSNQFHIKQQSQFEKESSKSSRLQPNRKQQQPKPDFKIYSNLTQVKLQNNFTSRNIQPYHYQEPIINKIYIPSSNIPTNLYHNDRQYKYPKYQQPQFKTPLYEPIKYNPLPTYNTEQADYYKDFTNTFLLQEVMEPYRSNIRKIKNNMRELRKPVGSYFNI